MIKPLKRDDDKYEYIELTEDDELPEGFELFDDDGDTDKWLSDETSEQGLETLLADNPDEWENLFLDDSENDLESLLEAPLADDEGLPPEPAPDAFLDEEPLTPETEDVAVPEQNSFTEQEETVSDLSLPAFEPVALKEVPEISEEQKTELPDLPVTAPVDEVAPEVIPQQDSTDEEFEDDADEEEVVLELDKNSGTLTGRYTEIVLTLNNINELADWQIFVWDRKFVPLSGLNGTHVFDTLRGVRYVTLLQDGRKKAEIFNPAQISWQQVSKGWRPVEAGFVSKDMSGSKGMISDELLPVILDEQFSYHSLEPKRGIITGPKGVHVLFAGLKTISLQIKEKEADNSPKTEFLKWYSGDLGDDYFEYSIASEASEITGNENIRSIYIKTGTSSYGWNVRFDNGIFMNLADVQEYQRRKGRLPDNNGVISYGRKLLTFKNIEKIISGRGAVRYFSYL